MPRELPGKNSNAKMILVTPAEDEYGPTLLQLSSRERQVLLQLSEYLDWINRWGKIPVDLSDKDTRDEWIDTLKRRLMEDIAFCAELIKCLNDDDDTREALRDVLYTIISGDSQIQQIIREVAQTPVSGERHTQEFNKNLLDTPIECDNDALYGAVASLVDWLHANNQDFLEKLAQAATPATRAAVMSQLIPDFQGGFLGDAISEALTYISGALKTNYEAFYDNSYREALICELWCVAQANCSLSVGQLYATFSSRVGYTPIGPDTFVRAFTFTVTGEITGYQFADVMMFLQVGSFIFMGGWLSYLGLNPLANQLTSGMDQPDDNWTDCDECPGEWCRYIDKDSGLDTLFEVFNNGFGNQAYWDGEKWVADVEAIQTRISISWVSTVVRNITDIIVHNTDEIDNGDTNTKTIYGPTATYGPLPGDVLESTFELNVAIGQFLIDCVSDASILSTNAIVGGIDWIKIKGFGTPPTFGVECVD